MTYWHMQMFLPQGRGGIEIDSKKLLEESPALIATGEWDNRQCTDFKSEIAINDIVCIKEGKKILALCRVIGANFKDSALTAKYLNENFRHVEVLDFYSGKEQFPQPQGTLQRATDSKTTTWQFINNWYTQILEKREMTHIIDLLKAKKQIILQGPPGTGKTYTAKDIAESMIFGEVSENKTEQKKRLESTDRFALVQFHPSYSYEDFVRGIVTKINEKGGIDYKVENKLLAQFAQKALPFSNPIDTENDNLALRFKEHLLKKHQLKIRTGEEYYFNEEKTIRLLDIYEYQDEEGLGRLRYETLLDDGVWRMQSWKGLEQHFDKKTFNILFNSDDSDLGQIKAHFRKYIRSIPTERRCFVLIIDEINRANLPSVLGELIYALEYRNESVDSIYAIDKDNSIVLPDNLYIIGTMNTADRSVGHIDYAIKRRFAFVDVLPKVEVIKNEKAKQLFELVSALFVKEDKTNSDHLASDFDYKDVQLGHSYFILKEGSEEEQTGELYMKLNYEIVPILNEYIKDGILLESAKEKLKEISGFEF